MIIGQDIDINSDSCQRGSTTEPESFMIKTTLLCGVVLTAIPFLAPAKDFPLEFKTLTAEEAMSFPGGSGISGPLQLDKPGAITKAPPAISKHPLYGQLSDRTNHLWFRIDESKGDGKSYDCLIVDMNQNGDLTDDPVVMRVDKPVPMITTNNERSVFGPIAVPDSKKNRGLAADLLCPDVCLQSPRSGSSPATGLPTSASCVSGPGWYLETTVDVDGVTRKVGIVDGNCSFRLGETSQPFTYHNGTETNWYFSGGDNFLLDNDGSGKFKSSVGNDESSPFGPLLYLGAKPCKAVLAADDKSLALEPWSGPLAELALQPHGEQVSEIQVAWESAPDQWQLLQPGVENGKAKVPPGGYRLIGCTLKVNSAAGGETLILDAFKRTPEGTVKAEAGATAPFKCGSPLEVKVTSERDTRNDVSSMQAFDPMLDRPKGGASSEKPVQQLIRAYVVGAGGETYGSFYLQGKGKLHDPPNPVFTVTNAKGKQVASGNMEFG